MPKQLLRSLFCCCMLTAGCFQDTPPSPQATRQILTALISDRDASVRQTAAEALGKIGDPAAESVLLKALRDPDPAVRAAAARSVGQLPSFGETVGTELVSLLRDPDSSVQRAAAQALGEADGIPELAQALMSLLTSPDPAVRQAAAHALLLVDTSTASVFEALAKGTSDSEPAVRQWVVAALAEAGDARAVPLLMNRLLNDPAESVQAEAAYRLRFIGNGSVAEALKTVVSRGGNIDVRRWTETSRVALRKASGSD